MDDIHLNVDSESEHESQSRTSNNKVKHKKGLYTTVIYLIIVCDQVVYFNIILLT